MEVTFGADCVISKPDGSSIHHELSVEMRFEI